MSANSRWSRRAQLKRQILDKLDELYTFDLPERLVDQEFEQIWKQVTQELENAGKTFEDEDTTEDEASEEYRTIAQRRVRLGLVLGEVGEEGCCFRSARKRSTRR